ncbi:hypothetical protein PENSPDRAFT_53974 [Peniophora sp. CONT]|nr:hypothetical protein PENSPDRAFT_53974 [Peniophora sp. CONT]
MSSTSHSDSNASSASSIPFPSTINTSTDSLAFSFSFDLTGEFPEGGVSEATIRSLRKAARILGEPVALSADGQLVPVALFDASTGGPVEVEFETRTAGHWGSVKRLFRRSGRDGGRKRRRVEKENTGGSEYEYEVVDPEGGRVDTDGWSEVSCGSRRPLVDAAGRRAGAKGAVEK